MSDYTSGFRGNVKMTAPSRFTLAIIVVLISLPSQGQIARRDFTNPSYEQPDLDILCSVTGNGFRQIDADAMPGWRTTHSLYSPRTSCGGPTPYRAIEVWESGFNGVTSFHGDQHVELNANESSRIYQEACVLANETVAYSYYHRARTNGTEISRAVLYDDTGTILIDSGPDDSETAADGWVFHNGSLTNNGVNGIRQFGFISVNSGSLGNFLDLAEIQLRPLIELVVPTETSDDEDGGSLTLDFRVNGELDNAATFTLLLDGTSTAQPTDFFVTPGALVGRGTIDSFSAVNGSITITLPAGIYDPNETNGSNGEQGIYSIPISFTTEGAIEADETIIYTTGNVAVGGGNTANRDLQFNDTDCDGTAVTGASFTINNDDVDINVTKTLDTTGPYSLGQELQYTMVVSNTAPGAVDATNVLVTDTPLNLTITSVSSTNCAAFPCTIALLPAGGIESITILATIDAAGSFSNSGGASADQTDENPDNNNDLGEDGNNNGAVPYMSVPVNSLWALMSIVAGLLLLARHKFARDAKSSGTPGRNGRTAM